VSWSWSRARGVRAVLVAAVAVLAWSVPALAGACPALAHGFGQRYDLPVPLWLYLYGAAGAVLLSFVALVGNLWALVNPLKVVFEWADGLARRLGVEEGLDGDAPYPASWEVWPALALFFVFVWVELVFPGSATPRNIAVLILLYSSVTWAGMSLFGKEAWLRGGEAFSVFFGILARFAPTEVRVAGGEACRGCDACGPEGRDGDCVNCYACFARAAPGERELNLRPPAVGLLRSDGRPAGRLAFVIFMLASVTYDGLLATPLWVSGMFVLQSAIGSFGVLGTLFFETLGLVVVPLMLFGLYMAFVKLCEVMGGGTGLWGLAGAFAYSLVPITLAYQAAHYYTLLITEGQGLFALTSNPFGWGWDLLGTAGHEVDVNVIGAAFVWYSQVALIVTGHVVAVYLAHAVALREAPSPSSRSAASYRWWRSWSSIPSRASGSSPNPSWIRNAHGVCPISNNVLRYALSKRRADGKARRGGRDRILKRGHSPAVAFGLPGSGREG
jgi:hypothetical protein